MIAVGDVQLEMALWLTVKGTVRELAAFMESLTSSGTVVEVAGEIPSDGERCEEASELCERFGFASKGCGR